MKNIIKNIAFSTLATLSAATAFGQTTFADLATAYSTETSVLSGYDITNNFPAPSSFLTNPLYTFDLAVINQAGAVAVTTPVTSAIGNNAYITQEFIDSGLAGGSATNIHNLASIYQTGDLNDAYIYQSGDGLIALISQTTDGNTAYITQTGTSNFAGIEQSALLSKSKAYVTQSGTLQSAFISQK